MQTWITFILAELLRNLFYIVGKKQRPNYAKSGAFRTFAGICFVFYVYPDPFSERFIDLFNLTLFAGTSFYILFDPVLNIVRGLDWKYRGENSGWLDRSPLWFYWTLKALCLIGLIYSLIVLI